MATVRDAILYEQRCLQENQKHTQAYLGAQGPYTPFQKVPEIEHRDGEAMLRAIANNVHVMREALDILTHNPNPNPNPKVPKSQSP